MTGLGHDFDEPILIRQKQTSVWPLSEGVKDDSAKVQLELIAPEIMFALGHVLTFGAVKYAPRNWELGMSWSRPFGAMMRHMWCWWGGKLPTSESFLFGNIDPETKFSHLWHAACCLMFLIAYEARAVGTDDRPNTIPNTVRNAGTH